MTSPSKLDLDVKWTCETLTSLCELEPVNIVYISSPLHQVDCIWTLKETHLNLHHKGCEHGTCEAEYTISTLQIGTNGRLNIGTQVHCMVQMDGCGMVIGAPEKTQLVL